MIRSQSLITNHLRWWSRAESVIIPPRSVNNYPSQQPGPESPVGYSEDSEEWGHTQSQTGSEAAAQCPASAGIATCTVTTTFCAKIRLHQTLDIAYNAMQWLYQEMYNKGTSSGCLLTIKFTSVPGLVVGSLLYVSWVIHWQLVIDHNVMYVLCVVCIPLYFVLICDDCCMSVSSDCRLRWDVVSTRRVTEGFSHSLLFAVYLKQT